MGLNNSNSIDEQERSNNVTYIRQSREQFLNRFKQFKAFYVNRETLDDDFSLDNKNRDTFRP